MFTFCKYGPFTLIKVSNTCITMYQKILYRLPGFGPDSQGALVSILRSVV